MITSKIIDNIIYNIDSQPTQQLNIALEEYIKKELSKLKQKIKDEQEKVMELLEVYRTQFKLLKENYFDSVLNKQIEKLESELNDNK